MEGPVIVAWPELVGAGACGVTLCGITALRSVVGRKAGSRCPVDFGRDIGCIILDGRPGTDALREVMSGRNRLSLK